MNRNHTSRWICAVGSAVFFGSSCASSRPMSAGGVEYLDRSSVTSIPQYSWLTDDIAKSLRLPRLRTVELPVGTRELRFWMGFGLVIPHAFVRIHETRGQAGGAVYWWWETERGSNDPFLTDLRREAGGECIAPQGRGYIVCPVQLGQNVDWDVLTKQLDDLQVFSLPDWSTLAPGVLGLDGFTLVVETLVGSEYRTFSYWCPWNQPHSEAKLASRIADLLISLKR